MEMQEVPIKIERRIKRACGNANNNIMETFNSGRLWIPYNWYEATLRFSQFTLDRFMDLKSIDCYYS